MHTFVCSRCFYGGKFKWIHHRASKLIFLFGGLLYCFNNSWADKRPLCFRLGVRNQAIFVNNENLLQEWFIYDKDNLYSYQFDLLSALIFSCWTIHLTNFTPQDIISQSVSRAPLQFFVAFFHVHMFLKEAVCLCHLTVWPCRNACTDLIYVGPYGSCPLVTSTLVTPV